MARSPCSTTRRRRLPPVAGAVAGSGLEKEKKKGNQRAWGWGVKTEGPTFPPEGGSGFAEGRADDGQHFHWPSLSFPPSAPPPTNSLTSPSSVRVDGADARKVVAGRGAPPAGWQCLRPWEASRRLGPVLVTADRNLRNLPGSRVVLTAGQDHGVTTYILPSCVRAVFICATRLWLSSCPDLPVKLTSAASFHTPTGFGPNARTLS